MCHSKPASIKFSEEKQSRLPLFLLLSLFSAFALKTLSLAYWERQSGTAQKAINLI